MELKKNRAFLLAITVLAVILLFGAVVARAAGTGDPGSVEDPLVTRSYVDSRISLQIGEAVNTNVEKYMQWKVADLGPGQQLEGKAGTEIIVRAGNTVVVDPVGSGIPDVTAGANITAGKSVSLDHHLIIPRTDGRGISTRTKAIVMYRGEIVIK
jgi:hypothetical protein